MNYEEVALTGIIADLRSLLDHITHNFMQAKILIRELAQRLDNLGKWEKSEICTQIKEILAKEIEEDKITEKWIEESLPREYKRKYTGKSELSSVSKKIEDIKVQGGNVVNTIDNGDGSTLLINHDTGV